MNCGAKLTNDLVQKYDDKKNTWIQARQCRCGAYTPDGYIFPKKSDALKEPVRSLPAPPPPPAPPMVSLPPVSTPNVEKEEDLLDEMLKEKEKPKKKWGFTKKTK